MSTDSKNVESASAKPVASPAPAKAAASVSGSSSTGAAAVAAPSPTPSAPLPFASRLPAPFQPTDFNLKGYHLDATVTPDQVVSITELLNKEGFAIDTITGVDWMAEQQMEVVYDYYHPVENVRAVVRTRVPRENPEVPTISNIYPGANWHERETHDFFGIRFQGHPNLTPFLLPEDATYHPLRKDFSA
jgi:NADH-quinone oxidoreductase subunit C